MPNTEHSYYDEDLKSSFVALPTICKIEVYVL